MSSRYCMSHYNIYNSYCFTRAMAVKFNRGFVFVLVC